jgi:Domain of unknown function (DUF4760)
MPDAFWGSLCGWVHLLSLWLKIHILPVAPLITATIATIAGIVAVVSIIVTKQLARRRAAIDFFLKTEADKSIVEIFQRFDESLETVNQDIDAGRKLKEIIKSKEYKDIHTCLNIHELLAIGVSNKVFDERVAYHYWSAALVSHRKKAEKLINFSREEPDDYSAYIGMIKLSEQWGKELAAWANKQRPVPQKPMMVPGPVTPTALDPKTQPTIAALRSEGSGTKPA